MHRRHYLILVVACASADWFQEQKKKNTTGGFFSKARGTKGYWFRFLWKAIDCPFRQVDDPALDGHARSRSNLPRALVGDEPHLWLTLARPARTGPGAAAHSRINVHGILGTQATAPPVARMRRRDAKIRQQPV